MTLLKRMSVPRINAWLWAFLLLLSFGVALSASGCKPKEASVAKTPGKAAITITSPQPGALVDSPLIVRGTAQASEGTVILIPITEDGRHLLIEEAATVDSEKGTFEAVLNFVPPMTADGYLEVFQRNAQGLETDKISLPVRFTTRSTDPQAYPTAYVKANTSMLEQPGGKEIRKDITKGRVVTIVKTKADWTQILIYTYDTPLHFTGWVPSSALTTDSSNLDLIEGILKSDATLWYAPPPDGKPKDYQAGGQPVLIWEKKNGWARCALTGGVEGWIQIKDIQFVGPKL